MKELNNKGFTLVEVIAVVVIMSILAIILIPNVMNYINQGRDDALKSLENSVQIAAKEFINDNRHNIVFKKDKDTNKYDFELNGIDELDGKKVIKVGTLLDNGYLSPSGTDSDGDYISHPNDRRNHLKLDNSYIVVEFNDSINDFQNVGIKLCWNDDKEEC